MTLGQLTEAIGALRSVPAQQIREAVSDLLPELRRISADSRIGADTRIGLLTRAGRAIDPRHIRHDDPAGALAAVEQLVSAGRGPGRPPVGPPVTVRLMLDALEGVDAHAVAAGLVDGSGEPRRAAMIRVLVDEALTARGGVASTPDVS